MIEILRWTVLHAQVCSNETEETALERLRIEMPAGTTGNWQKSDDPRHAAVICKDKPHTHKHYIYIC